MVTGDYNQDNRVHSKAQYDSERETRTHTGLQKQYMHVQILSTTDRSENQERELSMQRKDLHVHFAEQLVPCQYFNKELIGEHQTDPKNIPENTCLQELKSLQDSHEDEIQMYKIELICDINLGGTFQFDLNRCRIEVKHTNHLLKKYEELNEALKCDHQTLVDELQVEREKNKLLREELERDSVSYGEDRQKYKIELTDAKQLQGNLQLKLINAKEQAEILQFKLDQKTIENNTMQEHCKELQATLDCSHQTFADELRVQMETIGLVKEKLEAIKVSYTTQSEKYKTELVNTKEQAESLRFKLEQKIIENNTLQEHCKELQAKLECSHQSFADELKVEREKISLLKKELENNRVSFKNDHLKNETELIHTEQ